MGIIHGLSINGGKLDVQLSDSQFSKDSNGLLTLTDSFIANAAASEVAKVVANAPEDLNTLKEIAEYIESDKTGATELNNAISALQTGKMDKLGVGDGISFLDNVISVKAGQGLEFYGQEVQVKVGAGLEHASYGAGIAIKLSEWHYKIDGSQANGTPFKFTNTNGLSICLGSGLAMQSNNFHGNVLAVDAYQLVDEGSGLRSTQDNKLKVDPYQLAGDGITPNSDGTLSLNVSTSLKFSGTVLMVNAEKGLIETTTGLSVNTGNSLTVDTDNYLEVKPGHGLFVSNQGVNVKPGFGIETNDAGVSVKYGTGLAVDEISNELHIPLGTGLMMSSDGTLGVALGEGLYTNERADGTKELILSRCTHSGLVFDQQQLRIGSGQVDVINGATDNRAQSSISAIIGNSYGDIIFKLSTGLAVDKDGYLYVDTTQLAKTSSEA